MNWKILWKSCWITFVILLALGSGVGIVLLIKMMPNLWKCVLGIVVFISAIIAIIYSSYTSPPDYYQH